MSRRIPVGQRSRPLDGVSATRWVTFAKCGGCHRVVRDDYQAHYYRIGTATNQYAPYSRKWHRWVCWRCLMLLSRGAAYAFNPWPTPPMRQDAQNSEAGALQNTTAAGK